MSWYLRAPVVKQFMTKDKSEKVDTEVREDFPHLAVGVHRSVYHLGRNPREQQGSGQDRRLDLLLALDRQRLKFTGWLG